MKKLFMFVLFLLLPLCLHSQELIEKLEQQIKALKGINSLSTKHQEN